MGCDILGDFMDRGLNFCHKGIRPNLDSQSTKQCRVRDWRDAPICHHIEPGQFAGIDPPRHLTLFPPAQTIPDF